MKALKFFFLLVASTIVLSGCTTLKPVVLSINNSLEGYKYIYITPTSSITSSTGANTDSNSSVVLSSVNPSSVIAGFLMKKAFVQLPELREELKSETLIINYGESDKQKVSIESPSQFVEVTIQILSADDLRIVSLVTGTGTARTEADAIRVAIKRCMETLYPEG